MLSLSLLQVRPQAYISIDMLSNSSILELADEPHGWQAGDRLVVASTDYSMHQAEEFTILPCLTCTANQVKVQGMTSIHRVSCCTCSPLTAARPTDWTGLGWTGWLPVLVPQSHHSHQLYCGVSTQPVAPTNCTTTLVAFNSSPRDLSSSCIVARWPKSRVQLRLFTGLCF